MSASVSSSAITLKEEIIKTNEQEHDLAKWKFIVTAALGAAAFGFGHDQTRRNYWLLLFIPFTCAYIDLFVYQYGLRILAIARFLRDHHDDSLLNDYEMWCEEQRANHVFSLGSIADLSASIGVSVLGAAGYVLGERFNGGSEIPFVPLWLAAVLWSIGIFLIVFLWTYHKKLAARLSGTPQRSGVRKAEVHFTLR